jgi:hypothetical protein
MWTQRIRSLVAVLGLAIAINQGLAQVVLPPEILDDQLRELQQKHMADLKKVATEITAQSFPYPLYFSRTLGLSEKEQKRRDQRSIRFDKFRDLTVLEITANYYASYSAELMDKEQRARRTLEDVIVPMLKATIPTLTGEEKVQSFAIEISQHLRRNVLGVTNENCENVAFILSLSAARELIAATTSGAQEAALLHGQLFVNREPVEGWGLISPQVAAARSTPQVPISDLPQTDTRLTNGVALSHAIMRTSLSETPKLTVSAPARPPGGLAAEAHPEVSADSLKGLQDSHQAELDRLVRELDKQAHFVSYAPPAFIAFHKGAFLQISVVTTLKETAGPSQYQMAALAFDEHIAHLIRPVLAELKEISDFDGLDFSTTVRLAGTAEGSPLAVEFIFLKRALISYQSYDLTGQQLIDAGFVLINGERVSLELQAAETGFAPQP